MNKLYLSGGCFWCISDYFISLKKEGIIDIVVGYSGGIEKEATYELVKSQKTKHRETIEIIFDENKITIDEILNIFLNYVDIHDKDGQYIDKGHSYTLAMYYQNETEKEIFEKAISLLPPPVYISVEPFSFFVKAEEYHQHYANKNPEDFIKELESSHRLCHLVLKKTK